MRKKVRLLPALAFATALVPVAEAAAIVMAARHDMAISATPVQPYRPTVETASVQDPFSMSGHVASTAGYELIMVDSTPVLARIH